MKKIKLQQNQVCLIFYNSHKYNEADFYKYFAVLLSFTKEKEVFMQSTDQSWKPSVNIA